METETDFILGASKITADGDCSYEIKICLLLGLKPGLPHCRQILYFLSNRGIELFYPNVHRVGDTIQPSHSLLSPSPPALNLSQHQSLFQSVNSLHQVAKVLEFQL